MPVGKNKVAVSAYIPATLEPRLNALAEHRGQSVSNTAGDAIRDAVLEFEGDDTNRSKLRRIEAAQKHLENKLNMVMMLAFSQNGGEIAKLTADDVQRLRELVATLSE